MSFSRPGMTAPGQRGRSTRRLGRQGLTRSKSFQAPMSGAQTRRPDDRHLQTAQVERPGYGFALRRRRITASPARPAPNRASVAGSGTVTPLPAFCGDAGAITHSDRWPNRQSARPHTRPYNYVSKLQPFSCYRAATFSVPSGIEGGRRERDKVSKPSSVFCYFDNRPGREHPSPRMALSPGA